MTSFHYHKEALRAEHSVSPGIEPYYPPEWPPGPIGPGIPEWPEDPGPEWPPEDPYPPNGGDCWRLGVRVPEGSKSMKFTYSGVLSGLANVWVNWGDGNTQRYTGTPSGIVFHTYASVGLYTICIWGSFPNGVWRIDGLHKYKVEATSQINGFTGWSTFGSLFYTVENLTYIPSGLFADIDIPGGSFYNTFAYSGVRNIPSRLFDNAVSATSFSSTFKGTPVSRIPGGLFSNNILATAFNYVFQNTDITSIPAGLFSNNVLATTFAAAFEQCEELISVPEGLCRHNINVLDDAFSSMFHTCSNLRLSGLVFPSSIGVENPTQLFINAYNSCPKLVISSSMVRRLNISGSNYAHMFSLSTPYQGARPGYAPILWRDGDGAIRCFVGHSVASLKNYGDIPGGWK